MAILNEKTAETEKNIHLMVTPLCNRNCKYCCNKQYDLSQIPFVTDDEMRSCKNLFLTGGEPFLYAEPNEIAGYYKAAYQNIEKVIVYGNVYDFSNYMWRTVIGWNFCLNNIDGLTLSIKAKIDEDAWYRIVTFEEDRPILNLLEQKDTWLYVFDGFKDRNSESHTYKVFNRKWQEDFVPAPDSIFRRI